MREVSARHENLGYMHTDSNHLQLSTEGEINVASPRPQPKAHAKKWRSMIWPLHEEKLLFWDLRFYSRHSCCLDT